MRAARPACGPAHLPPQASTAAAAGEGLGTALGGGGSGRSGVEEEYAREVVRAGGAELHCVAAIVGAVVAQEAIKLVTRQFVPLGGVFVYNGIAGTTAVLPGV